MSHPRIELLNTGTELLLGTTTNTHGAWLGQRLLELGLRVSHQSTVPDGPPITRAINDAIARGADALIITGGLGPTSDDVTREACAEALGHTLMEDEAALRSIRAYFAERGRPMAPDNRRQALVPVGADVLPNPNGTAPGIYLPPRMSPKKPCAVFLLPGPPTELHPMFLTEALPRLKSLFGVDTPPTVRELKFTGIGESDFHHGIDAKLASIPDLEHGYCARPGELDLRLIGTQKAVEQAQTVALERFRQQLVSADGSSLEATVVALLQQNRHTLATAESCTGGLIAERLTRVPGSSDVFGYGFVTYANEAKEQLIGVPRKLLEAHGAVSPQVAAAMAEGALRESGADWAITTTGIAGPGGGSAEKPVGTVYLGLAGKDIQTHTKHCHFRAERLTFKQLASQSALDLVRRTLRDLPLG